MAQVLKTFNNDSQRPNLLHSSPWRNSHVAACANSTTHQPSPNPVADDPRGRKTQSRA
jgi:hypothetical protein